MDLRPDLWHCADCETAYAVGLPACPQCGSADRADAPQPPPAPAPKTPPAAEPEEM